jgi:hypothetical protein
MNTQLLTSPVKFLLIIVGLTTISACASTEPGCPSPQTRNLDSAISFVKTSLNTGCEAHFEISGSSANFSSGRATRAC